MSKNIDNIYKYSTSSFENTFFNIMLNLSKEEIASINFELLDNNIINNDYFSIKTKTIYDNYFGRNIFDKSFKRIISKPFDCRYYDLLFLAKKMPNLRKQLLDIACIRSYDDQICNEFIEQLQSSNLYKKYIDSVMKSDDILLKVHLALYFGYLDKLFSNHLELAKTIVENDELSIFSNFKSNHLLRLSKLSKNIDALYYIKNNLKKVIENEYECDIINDDDSSIVEIYRNAAKNYTLNSAMETFKNNTRGLID